MSSEIIIVLVLCAIAVGFILWIRMNDESHKKKQKSKRAKARRNEKHPKSIGEPQAPPNRRSNKSESDLDTDDIQLSQRCDEDLHALQESIGLSVEATGAVLQVSLLRA